MGAESVIHVNEVYPEGWRIDVLAVEPLQASRVLSLVRVDHGASTHYAHSWFTFTDEEPPRIATIEEFWAAAEPPPAWRDGLPGRVSFPEACTARPL